MIFSTILSVPSLAFNIRTGFHRLNNEEPVSTGNLRNIMMLYSGIITTITTILYLIPQVALAFQYFSLVERKEKPTLLDKINEIGKDTSI
jgi:Fe2+ transport system protein B